MSEQNNNSPDQNQAEIITHWDLIKEYGAARRSGLTIGIVGLGYTMLEMSLVYLLRSKAGRDQNPITVERIDECEYMMELANLAKDEGFFDGDTRNIYERIKEYNQIRRKAVHHIRYGTVKPEDLRPATDIIGPLLYDIQNLWLPITVGKEQKVKR